ncbi:hypothetical protein [Arthrobacter sp. C9C5]|uniref:hypothetical protein n=1 Tax=Arthrobacter sp. C9C5 TaxID=2735267 RepID=UPI0015849AFB|nr:hypothetical protein [Arthrobacter sp. C9C5]NUU30834.1 hypothetical protein [Arthrobacter sp. C9C5]
MGILIGIVVLFVVGLVFVYGVAGWLGFGLYLSESKAHQKAEESAPAILDEAFVGDDVVFKINPRSPKYETVVLGAKSRGYRLMNETQDTAGGSARTLIFEKAN